MCKQKIYANVCKSKNFEDFSDEPSRQGILKLPQPGRGVPKNGFNRDKSLRWWVVLLPIRFWYPFPGRRRPFRLP